MAKVKPMRREAGEALPAGSREGWQGMLSTVGEICLLIWTIGIVYFYYKMHGFFQLLQMVVGDG